MKIRQEVFAAQNWAFLRRETFAHTAACAYVFRASKGHEFRLTLDPGGAGSYRAIVTFLSDSSWHDWLFELKPGSRLDVKAAQLLKSALESSFGVRIAGEHDTIELLKSWDAGAPDRGDHPGGQ
jgi:hypothetical protein